MKVDWTLSIGTVIEIVTFLCVGLAAFFNIRSDVRNVETRVTFVEGENVKQSGKLDHILQMLAEHGFPLRRRPGG